jgi:Zn-dependent peptidase ImmA (M78 family)
MKLLIPTIKKFFPDFNQRVHTEADAYDFCARHKIITIETDLINVPGQYRVHRERPIILLHKYIDRHYRNWVFHHEITHFILHPTTMATFSDEISYRKIENEANFVAAVLLMPRHICDSMKVEEIQEEFGYSRRLVLIRKYIKDNFGE